MNSYWPFLFNKVRWPFLGLKGRRVNERLGVRTFLKRPAQWRTLCPPPLPELIIQSHWFHSRTQHSPFMDNRAGTSRTPVWTSVFFIYGEHNWNWRLCIVCSKIKDYSVVFVHFKPVFFPLLSFTLLSFVVPAQTSCYVHLLIIDHWLQFKIAQYPNTSFVLTH